MTVPRLLHKTPNRQRGMATLVTSVVFLLLASILALVISRTTIIEQRMSANQIRHKQAFEAAQAGMVAAMIFLNTSPQGADKDLDNDNDAADGTVAATLANNSQYKVAFCNPNNVPANDAQVCPYAPADDIDAALCTAVPATMLNTPLVVACGWSDDGIGRQMIRQSVGTVSPIASPPTNPLTAKGALNVGGSANVVNYFNNLTIWTGGSLTSIGNSGKTFVRNPNVPPPPPDTEPPGEPNTCSASTDYVCLTDKNTTGPDVIDHDPTLANLSDADMFKNYFSGRTLDEVKATVESREVAATDVNEIVGARGETIVVTGNTTLPNGQIGTRDRPVVLIIDGDVSFQGSPTVYGIVYVTGNVTGGGTPTIQGAMVVEGSMNPTGSVDIIYDPFVTSNTANSGRPGWIPGTWRDWR